MALMCCYKQGSEQVVEVHTNLVLLMTAVLPTQTAEATKVLKELENLHQVDRRTLQS